MVLLDVSFCLCSSTSEHLLAASGGRRCFMSTVIYTRCKPDMISGPSSPTQPLFRRAVLFISTPSRPPLRGISAVIPLSLCTRGKRESNLVLICVTDPISSTFRLPKESRGALACAAVSREAVSLQMRWGGNRSTKICACYWWHLVSLHCNPKLSEEMLALLYTNIWGVECYWSPGIIGWWGQ